ncbi:tRNA-dihydrouridine synthase [Chondromyces crocatus]|uniref:NADH-dependent flavin oxidoreductase n=1 Tax=Chondromyces crocatus TaxID=52 RepID=A0A0K1EQG8_CHOCO|nr:NADH:flavin oxidoreductase [Chondromyces crocatus]AKT42902.1 NADH-dependent flavin oxidoreductase [Chondromyces crocatus]
MTTTDLFSPLTFRNGVTAPNRLAVAAMTNSQSHDDGTLSDDELRWLEARAEGGFGLVATCASHVALDGQGWPGELGIYDDHLLPGLTRLASSLRARGALSIVQIFHGGTRSPSTLTGQMPWSASATEDPEPVRAAEEADIERVIRQFAEAARRAHQAGFDGVELHGAHGYLLCQFLSATLNRRSDGWGGDLAGRARLIREATRAVRAAVPASFVVGVRLSPEDFGNAVGMDLDESLQTAKWLCEDGMDFLHISLWDAAKNTKKRPEEHPIPLFRKACPAEVPLLVAGKVWTRADAQALVDRGADMVALGRSAILNPDWPKQVQEAGWEPRRPPMKAEELVARSVSPTFVGYLRRWKNFVAEEEG